MPIAPLFAPAGKFIKGVQEREAAMLIRTSRASWEGGQEGGAGTIYLHSGAFEAPFSAGSRFGHHAGSNPEELLGGALAGSFVFALAQQLSEAGYAPVRLETVVRVELNTDSAVGRITDVELEIQADVPALTRQHLGEIVQSARDLCPICHLLHEGTTLRVCCGLYPCKPEELSTVPAH